MLLEGVYTIKSQIGAMFVDIASDMGDVCVFTTRAQAEEFADDVGLPRGYFYVSGDDTPLHSQRKVEQLADVFSFCIVNPALHGEPDGRMSVDDLYERVRA